MTNQDLQILKLNTEIKLKIAPSKIHGVGVFAIRDIQKGHKLYADSMPSVYKIPFASFNKLFPEVRELIIERWAVVVNNSPFILPDARMLAYMNHSDDPNYDNQTDVALKDIKKDEEVTENYLNIENWDKAFPWLDK